MSAMSILEKIEDKIERVAQVGLDHTKVTAELKKEVEGVEATIDDKLAAFKRDLLSTVTGMVADVKAEIIGDLGTVSTDTVDASSKAVADLGTASSDKPTVAPEAPEVPVPAEPVVTTVDAATITIDPAAGTTTHADAATGVTTTVPHDGSAPTAVDSTSTSVTPPPAAVAAAVDAAAAAGVTVPAPVVV